LRARDHRAIDAGFGPPRAGHPPHHAEPCEGRDRDLRRGLGVEPDDDPPRLRGEPGELRGHEPGDRGGPVAPCHRPGLRLRRGARGVPVFHAGHAVWKGRHQGGHGMSELAAFIDRYVSVWNETDPDARKRSIVALWAPDGTTCNRQLEACGYEAIEARV